MRLPCRSRSRARPRRSLVICAQFGNVSTGLSVSRFPVFIVSSRILKTSLLVLIGVLALAMLLAGCASTKDEKSDDDAWVQAYLEAMRLEPRAAEAELARLAETAPTEEKARDMEFERARLALRRGDVELARRRFQSLWDARSDDAVASRSLYELARMAEEEDGNIDESRRLLRKTILETRPWAGSELALKFLVLQERRAHRFEWLVDELTRLAERSDDAHLLAQLHLERGLVLDEALGRPDEALDAYRMAHRASPDTAATDEALFQMGQIYARFQMWEPAVTALEIVADRTARSFGVGTYHSQRAADARYELALIEMLFRDDYDAAQDHFRTFQRTFPQHRLSEDVAWHLVEIERLTSSDRAYRRALRRFVDDYPHSRRTDRARQILGEAT